MKNDTENSERILNWKYLEESDRKMETNTGKL